jgi:hypothetical protein
MSVLRDRAPGREDQDTKYFKFNLVCRNWAAYLKIKIPSPSTGIENEGIIAVSVLRLQAVGRIDFNSTKTAPLLLYSR